MLGHKHYLSKLASLPPPVAQSCIPVTSRCAAVTAAEGVCVYEGDRVLEVNGVSVRGASHQEVGRLIADSPHTVTLLLHSHKPRPVPCGSTVYSGWLGKKGGSGITPRNWRRRWFVLRDDCIAYYYGNPEVYTWCLLWLLALWSCRAVVCAGHTCPGGHCSQKLHHLQGST